MNFLNIKRVSDSTFESENLWCPFPSYAAFGGQLSAQSLAAGLETIPEDSFPNLVHTLFVNPGDPTSKIEYKVETIKEGKNFSMREIRGIQNNTLVCLTTMSASTKDSSTREFSFVRENLVKDNYVPLHEYVLMFLKSMKGETKSKEVLKKQYDLLMENLGLLNSTFNVELGSTINNRRQIRIRIMKEEVSQREFSLLMTLASDLLLVESALISLNLNIFSKELYKACSIDHNLHFVKNAVPKDKTVYYIVRCDNVIESKAVIEGKLVNEHGDVFCLTSQQALIRLKK